VGLFGDKQKAQKKSPQSDVETGIEQQVLDEHFREQLRHHGREYFEEIIMQNGSLFKRDLDATLARINEDLKEHVTQQLDDAIERVSSELKDGISKQLIAQVGEHARSLKEAQDQVFESMSQSLQAVMEQHEHLAQRLQKNVADQQTMMSGAFEQSKVQMTTTKNAQEAALQWLTRSAEALQQQHEQLSETLQKSVVAQESMLIASFEQNMAKITEHYLMEALGDQFDLKAQLPAIIKQLEANKQAIVDDMKL